MLENLLTLGMLVMLQAVLGFDNLLYVSLESKRAPEADRKRVQQLGIGFAIVLRLVLLFVLIQVIGLFQDPVLTFDQHAISASFNIHSMIVLAGGAFIIYTAMKEILHMLSLEDVHGESKPPATKGRVIAMIMVMNLVFSFDSILSAMALTDVFWVMATAIIIGGVLMIVLANRVSEFLAANRMYEVLGLFILFLVGVMLVTEGGHLAHLHFFGHEIVQMSKATFYFVLSVLVLVDVVQSRYRRKLDLLKARKPPAKKVVAD